jgi:hypothetical protein
MSNARDNGQSRTTVLFSSKGAVVCLASLHIENGFRGVYMTISPD